MKISFFASLVTALASVNAFAPSQSRNARSSTSLNSHFTTISTKLYNKASLLKALNDLGVQNVKTATKEETSLIARGHEGNTVQDADIVISQPNDYDIAFSYNGESYQLVADLQFWQQSMPVDAFMEKLQQTYAVHQLVDTSAQDGFQVETVKQSVDGTVTLELSRYNTAGM